MARPFGEELEGRQRRGMMGRSLDCVQQSSNSRGLDVFQRSCGTSKVEEQVWSLLEMQD